MNVPRRNPPNPVITDQINKFPSCLHTVTLLLLFNVHTGCLTLESWCCSANKAGRRAGSTCWGVIYYCLNVYIRCGRTSTGGRPWKHTFAFRELFLGEPFWSSRSPQSTSPAPLCDPALIASPANCRFYDSVQHWRWHSWCACEVVAFKLDQNWQGLKCENRVKRRRLKKWTEPVFSFLSCSLRTNWWAIYFKTEEKNIAFVPKLCKWCLVELSWWD